MMYSQSSNHISDAQRGQSLKIKVFFQRTPSIENFSKSKLKSKKHHSMIWVQALSFLFAFSIPLYTIFGRSNQILIRQHTSPPAPYSPPPPSLASLSDFDPSCGTWPKDYVEHHRQSVFNNSHNLPRRSLIYYCNSKKYDCGGLGDQLIGIETSFIVSLLLNRAFFISYPHFDSAFEPVHVDWRMSKSLNLDNCDELRQGSPVISTSRNSSDCIHISMVNSNPWEQLTFKWIETVSANYETVVFRSNHGNSIAFLRSKEWWGKKLTSWRFDENNMAGCLFRFLLRPSSKVRKMVSKLESKLTARNVFSVCIHARLIKGGIGDDSYLLDPHQSSISTSSLLRNIEFVFQCAQNITDYFSPPSQEVKWFFASSSARLREKVYELHPEKILRLDIVPRHVGIRFLPNFSSELQNLVSEWYLLSKCKKFVFLSSGLSKTSAAYSLNVNASYMFPHKLFGNATEAETEWQKYCQPTSPTSARDMAYEWSGFGLKFQAHDLEPSDVARAITNIM